MGQTLGKGCLFAECLERTLGKLDTFAECLVKTLGKAGTFAECLTFILGKTAVMVAFAITATFLCRVSDWHSAKSLPMAR